MFISLCVCVCVLVQEFQTTRQKHGVILLLLLLQENFPLYDTILLCVVFFIPRHTKQQRFAISRRSRIRRHSFYFDFLLFYMQLFCFFFFLYKLFTFMQKFLPKTEK